MPTALPLVPSLGALREVIVKSRTIYATYNTTKGQTSQILVKDVTI
jgi:hypothetical protein